MINLLKKPMILETWVKRRKNKDLRKNMVNPLRNKRNSNKYKGSSGKYTAEAIERDFKRN